MTKPAFTLLRGALAKVPALRVPFARAGCAIHRQHRPVPATSELHHVFPLYLQHRIWPEVDPANPASAKVKDRVALCGTGHSDVHLALDYMLVGKPKPRGIGASEFDLARQARQRFWDAGGVWS